MSIQNVRGREREKRKMRRGISRSNYHFVIDIQFDMYATLQLTVVSELRLEMSWSADWKNVR